MTDGAVSTATGNIRYMANADISLASLNGTNVLVTTTGGAIIDNGESDVDVIATTAQLVAGTAVGEVVGSGNGFIETTVATLAASASSGGIYLNETDNLTIGSVAAISVDRILNTGSTVASGGSVLTGAVATTDVLVQAGNGIIIDNVVTATGDDVLLNAQNGDLAINALVTSGDNATFTCWFWKYYTVSNG